MQLAPEGAGKRGARGQKERETNTEEKMQDSVRSFSLPYKSQLPKAGPISESAGLTRTISEWRGDGKTKVPTGDVPGSGLGEEEPVERRIRWRCPGAVASKGEPGRPEQRSEFRLRTLRRQRTCTPPPVLPAHPATPHASRRRPRPCDSAPPHSTLALKTLTKLPRRQHIGTTRVKSPRLDGISPWRHRTSRGRPIGEGAKGAAAVGGR